MGRMRHLFYQSFNFGSRYDETLCPVSKSKVISTNEAGWGHSAWMLPIGTVGTAKDPPCIISANLEIGTYYDWQNTLLLQFLNWVEVGISIRFGLWIGIAFGLEPFQLHPASPLDRLHRINSLYTEAREAAKSTNSDLSIRHGTLTGGKPRENPYLHWRTTFRIVRTFRIRVFNFCLRSSLRELFFGGLGSRFIHI